MVAKLKKGDKVEWSTSQGKTKGVVKKKLTSPMKIKGHKVAASKKNPEYLVESSKSGDKAAHKAESLKKTSSKSASSKKKTSSAKKSSSASSAKKKTAKKSAAKKSAKSGSTKKKTGGSTVKKTTKRSSAKKTSSKTSSAKKDDEQFMKDFKELVNLSPKQLERWLDTDESKKVGFKDEGEGESVGHESGRKIIKLLGKRKDKYTDEDVKHIHKVVGYIKRHLAQRPKGDIMASNWRYSLMNWGHDPAK